MAGYYDELLQAGGGSVPDPYAAIRRIPAAAVHDYQHPAYNAQPGEGMSSPGWMDKRVDFGAIPGFASLQSKYLNSYSDGQGAGTFDSLWVSGAQQPGQHKYDTQTMEYRRDPATGDYVLVDTDLTRQKSTLSKVAPAIALPAIGLGAQYLLPQLTGGAAASGAAAGGAAGAGGLGGGYFGAAGITEAATAGLGAGWGGAASGAGATSGVGSFLAGNADKAALLGNAGYGAGMTGAETAVFDGVLGATDSTSLASGANWLQKLAGGAGSLLSGGGGARSIFDLVSGIYGLKLADDAREASDPFAQYRGAYGAELAALEANPSSITSRPGWQAGMEAIQRNNAARGYAGSGNEMAVMSRYGGEFYNNEANRLAGLAGANVAPGAGQVAAAQLANLGVSSIGYGLAPYIGGPRGPK
jgi:hypothetical protein